MGPGHRVFPQGGNAANSLVPRGGHKHRGADGAWANGADRKGRRLQGHLPYLLQHQGALPRFVLCEVIVDDNGMILLGAYTIAVLQRGGSSSLLNQGLSLISVDLNVIVNDDGST
eukprot:9470147-Pyramimonas_sp.AAC.3